MKRPVALVNGQAVDLDSPAIFSNDRGFTLGDGVFESLRAYGGKPFLLARHMERLVAGAAVLRIPLRIPLSEIASQVERALRLNGLGTSDAYLRITLTRGPAERGLRVPADPQPTLAVMGSPLVRPPVPSSRAGKSAILAAVVRRNEVSPACALKTVGQVENILASMEAEDRGANEALLTNHAGDLAEGVTTNLFWVSRGRLYTPEPGCGCLPGITRAAVIQIAAARGIDVVEGRFDPAALGDADEAFLTSSLIEIEPLVRLDGRDIGRGGVGPITLSLMEAFRNGTPPG